MLMVPARTNKLLARRIMRLTAQMPLLDSSSQDQMTAALRIILAA
ncbi:hypothetical protein MMCCUG48898_2540 [Mycobacteroides abscessus subsp. massiliense CCUG 48898 = JCM 15300]|nr:hypothetical protein MMCCUG48898_2540 [Mycobacteroides abscessus subsp. massiliense CCUG 48898 = JCM 15300]